MKHKFVIEKGILLPGVNHGQYNETLESMEEGDSVQTTQKEAACFLRVAHQLGITVTTRKMNGYYRVWLVRKSPKKHRSKEPTYYGYDNGHEKSRLD